MITVNGHKITPTIFPDKTSQVWKLPPLPQICKVIWEFEEEREIIDLLSVYNLLENLDKSITIQIPYLPYARQDKEISNETTFNLTVFEQILSLINCPIYTLDCHGRVPEGVSSFIPAYAMSSALIETQATKVVFPDAGAMARYEGKAGAYRKIICQKIRNQSTGEIDGMTYTGDHQIGDVLLIIDDICDGGRTFIEIAKLLAPEVKEIHLYVTHGIFSKGLAPLREAGIKRIFTHKGEL